MPVTSGFTSATSIIIIVSQLQGLLGLRFKAHSIIGNLIKIFQNVRDIRMPDFILGVCSIAFLLFFRVSLIQDVPIVRWRNAVSAFSFFFEFNNNFDTFSLCSNWKTLIAVLGKAMVGQRSRIIERCTWRSCCGFFPSVATLW